MLQIIAVIAAFAGFEIAAVRHGADSRNLVPNPSESNK